MEFIKEWIAYQKINNQINHPDFSNSNSLHTNHSESSVITIMVHIPNVSELALSLYQDFEPTYDKLILINPNHG